MQPTRPLTPAEVAARKLERAHGPTCVECDEKLAILSGWPTRTAEPAIPGYQDLTTGDPNGKPLEKYLERDATGRISDRASRGIYVGCGVCLTPAPLTHPLQVKVDADWKAHEAKEKAERDRAAAAPPPPPVVFPVQSLEENLDRLRKTVADQDAKIAAQHEQITDLQKQVARKR